MSGLKRSAFSHEISQSGHGGRRRIISRIASLDQGDRGETDSCVKSVSNSGKSRKTLTMKIME